MEKSNQRLIFDLPEDVSSAKIISDILQKNGVAEDTFEDLSDKERTPKIVIISRAIENFFGKTVSEQKMAELFQDELKITKETALQIVNDLKTKLIPFARKITIPADGKIIAKVVPPKFELPTISENIPKEERPSQNFKKPAIPTEENPKILTGIKPKIKKLPEIKQDLKPNITQKNGPYTYREPIEYPKKFS